MIRTPPFFILMMAITVVAQGAPIEIPTVPLPLKADDFAKLAPAILGNLKARMPKPFQVTAEGECETDDDFTIAGHNTDEVLEKTPCIGGIPMSVLTARLLPQKWPAIFPASVDKVLHKKLSGKITLKARTDLYRKWLQTKIFAKLPPPWKGDPWRNSNKLHSRVSSDGFLNVGQNLRDVLLSDNETANDLKLTHQQIAQPLLEAIEKYEQASETPRQTASETPSVPFTFKDYTRTERHYVITGLPMGHLVKSKMKSGWGVDGTQGSPFHDDLHANWILKIQRLSTGDKPLGPPLTIDALTPYLIYRYGFYQGGQFRASGPVEIAQFFGLRG